MFSFSLNMGVSIILQAPAFRGTAELDISHLTTGERGAFSNLLFAGLIFLDIATDILYTSLFAKPKQK